VVSAVRGAGGCGRAHRGGRWGGWLSRTLPVWRRAPSSRPSPTPTLRSSR